MKNKLIALVTLLVMSSFMTRIDCLPADNSKDYVKVPTSIKESLETGVQGEIENIVMYERFLNQNIPSDVKTVFTSLKSASQNHLQAFKRALQSY
ncbi:hypothetical protein ACER0A_005265 [Haloimpatiens sp. FM7315]|uniref:hypothetical protein n=1 Tax=Haloimpatiens sp. FM7315 TaxID=3298609 RepID=UPI0035A34642